MDPFMETEIKMQISEIAKTKKRMPSWSSRDREIPEFFSVFLSDHCSHQLLISSAFKSHLDSTLLQRRRSTIRRPGTNKEWVVDLVKENNEFYFKEGWEKVVKENNLKHGEFMVFRYLGESVFTVSMLGKHACLKESVIEGENIADVELVDDFEEHDDDDAVLGKRSRAGRPSREDPKSEAVQAAKFYMKTHSDYPSFRVPIGPGYFQHCLVNIPLHFVDAYMKRTDKRTIYLQVMDKIWSVTMLVYRQFSPNCKLTKGVPAFIDSNNIQEGDVLVFELVKPDTFREGHINISTIKSSLVKRLSN